MAARVKKPVPALPPDAQVFTLAGNDRLWRCQMAVALLAAVTEDVAHDHGISHDSTAAIAELVRDDMLGVLNQSAPLEDLI